MSEVDRHFMTVADVAAFLLYDKTAKDPASAARQWLQRKGVPTFMRGRHVLCSKKEVVDALANKKKRRAVTAGARA